MNTFHTYYEGAQVEKVTREARLFSNNIPLTKMGSHDGKENVSRESKSTYPKLDRHNHKKDEGNKNLQLAPPSELPVTTYLNITNNQPVEKPGTATYPSHQNKTKEQTFMMPQKLNSNGKMASSPSDECFHKNIASYRCQYCKDCGIFIPKVT